MPDKFNPFMIEPLAGINRRDEGKRFSDNEFFTLQNWYPKIKALLYKRPGTTEDTAAAEFFGASRIDAVYSQLGLDRVTRKYHYCRPDPAVLLPQPSTVLGLAEIDGGNLFDGGAVQTMHFTYTWVGMGMESLCHGVANGAWDGSFLWGNGTFDSIVVSNNTKGVRVTIPAFPAGVKSANIFAGGFPFAGPLGTNRLALIGTIRQSGGTLDFLAPLADGTTHNDAFVSWDDVQGYTDGAGKLKSGVTYYVSGAWFGGSEYLRNNSGENVMFPYLFPTIAVRLKEGQNAIRVSTFSPAASANGAKAIYVFAGLYNRLVHPMQLIGVKKSNGGGDPLDILDIPTNQNASSCPANLYKERTWGGALFAESDPADTIAVFSNRAILSYKVDRDAGMVDADPQNTDRHAFVISKDEDDVVSELLPSRTDRDVWLKSTGATLADQNVDSPFFPATQGDRRADVGFLHSDNSAFKPDGWGYSRPQLASLIGLSYFANGLQISHKTDGFSVGSIIEDFETIQPRNLRRLITFKDSLVGATTDTPDQIYATNASEPRSWVQGGTGTDLRFMTVGSLEGGAVTALGVFSYTSADSGPTTQLLAAKKFGLWRTAAFSDPVSGIVVPLEQLSKQAGIEAYRTLLTSSIGTLFLGSNGILYLISNTGEPLPIGGKVQALFEHLQSEAALGDLPSAIEHESFLKIAYPSSIASTVNDAQVWADLRTQDRSPITWSGPHIGVGVDSQIIDPLTSERIGGRSDAVGALHLDDFSTFQDLASAIVSVAITKNFDFGLPGNKKQIAGAFLDLFYDTAFNHTIKVEGFASENYAMVQKILSSGGAVWDSSSWDNSVYGGALFVGHSLYFGADPLIGRVYKQQITHEDNAEIIMKSIGIFVKPERRRV